MNSRRNNAETYWSKKVSPIFAPLLASVSIVRSPVSVSPDGRVHPGSPPKKILYEKEAFKIDPETGDLVEADTDDSESFDLSSLLLPPVSSWSSFGVYVDSGLLDGWVKQPSPCCGAASVAGAVNGIRGRGRGGEGAIGHMDVLPVMADMLREQMEGKRGTVERMLGGVSVEPLVEKVKTELEGMGRTLGGKEKNGAKKGCPKKLLWEIVRRLGGIEKVTHPLKPSTGPFGNWGILGAVSRLSDADSSGWTFKASVIMGKKRAGKGKDPGYVGLSRKDGPALIEQQWCHLKGCAARGGSCLISHHKNHYALIFAWREYEARGEEGKRRECFTARKGQRPTEWVDFMELRETYLSWEGYKLMLVEGKKL
ncbi:hypothetical protein TrRE_jg10945 [Triparma retinervis]|uniref:Uncharacterized protein n=1 Tax=Triparma retinervis TaxID=2557542 RepID=A0A9W6ZZ61_9STRA|nr:hypothetical protein TrRE_jg10945 [Triparma retinervis]